MLKRTILMMVVVLGVSTQNARATTIADVLCYYEQGIHAYFGYTDPDKALHIGDIYDVVSLGQWTDDAGTGENDRPVGLLLGFSTSIPNGPGNDLKIVGNALSDQGIGAWYEPGYVEVAQETSGSGATPDGWEDETFYLIKPGNYDDPHVGDPRTAAIPISYTWHLGDPNYGTYDDPWWQDSGNNLYGYADVTEGGDLMDIADAIDADGNYAYLFDIAYVRIRTVTDSPAAIFGYFTTEINCVVAVPEPSSVALLTVMVLSFTVFAAKRWLRPGR